MAGKRETFQPGALPHSIRATEVLGNDIHFNRFKLRNVNPFAQSFCMDERRIVVGKEATPTAPPSAGPNFPGGFLLFPTIYALQHGWVIGKGTLTTMQTVFQEAGITTGVHEGHHENHPAQTVTNYLETLTQPGNKKLDLGDSGCGYADKLPDIIRSAVTDRAAISQILSKHYNDLSTFLSTNLGISSEKAFVKALNQAFAQIGVYNPAKVELQRKPLVAAARKRGAEVSHVEGEHTAIARYINLEEGTTFDTNAASRAGEPAFNFDLWALVKQVNQANTRLTHQKFDLTQTVMQSLILYEATARVLLPEDHTGAILTIHE